MSELKVFIIFFFILFLTRLYFLFRFVFQPSRDLMAQPPLFFILLTAMGLGWVRWLRKLSTFALWCAFLYQVSSGALRLILYWKSFVGTEHVSLSHGGSIVSSGNMIERRREKAWNNDYFQK